MMSKFQLGYLLVSTHLYYQNNRVLGWLLLAQGCKQHCDFWTQCIAAPCLHVAITGGRFTSGRLARKKDWKHGVNLCSNSCPRAPLEVLKSLLNLMHLWHIFQPWILHAQDLEFNTGLPPIRCTGPARRLMRLVHFSPGMSCCAQLWSGCCWRVLSGLPLLPADILHSLGSWERIGYSVWPWRAAHVIPQHDGGGGVKIQICGVITVLGGFRSNFSRMFSRWAVNSFYQVVAPPVILPIL